MKQTARTTQQLGKLISNARQQQHLSQQALADLVGTGQKTISRIETGQPGTKIETIFAILAALKLDIQVVARVRQDDFFIGDIF